MSFRDHVRKGLTSVKSVSGGYGGTIGGFWNRWQDQPGSKNWAEQAGLRYDNSIVYAAILGAWNWMTEVDIYVRRPVGVGKNGQVKYEEVPNHEITQLIMDPCPWYDGATYLGACIVSELAGPGYSCTYKHRSSGGRVIALEYVPHHAIAPYTGTAGNFIDWWQMSVPGGSVKVDPRNILQQRFGFMDPRRVQTAVGPILAALLEVATDKEAAHYTLSILHNMGVTPTAISPNMKGEDGQPFAYTSAQLDEIEEVINNKITGDKRGKPVVFPLPISVDQLGSDPAKLNLDALRNIPEERICAALGIHPLSLYLGTALEQSNNRASSSSAFTQTARSFTKPYMKKKARQLTRDLVPELGEPGDEVCFRIDEIEALQDDKTEAAKRDQMEVGGPWKTANEKRAERGLEAIEGGDQLYRKSSGKPDEDDEEDALVNSSKTSRK